jgi:dihydrodipicolinate synthase/N-acetylneuraminate lyase
MLELAGRFAPIVTPMTDDGGSVSEIRLARLVKHLLENGVQGFVCGTETGEFATTITAERKAVLEILMRETHGLPVLAHCTCIGTAQALDLCQHAARHGALAAVLMPPHYGIYSDEELEHHIRSIVNHAGLPVIVVDPQHVLRAATMESLDNLRQLYYGECPEAAFRTRFAVDPIGAGSDEFVLGDLIVSPLIQVDPVASLAVDSDLHPIARLIGRYGRPRVAKAALNLRDIEVGPPRLPVLPLPHEVGVELQAVIQTA